MDAYTAGLEGDPYVGSAPILIAGDSDAAVERAARTVRATGARIGGALLLGEAVERISIQASASAIWVELDGDGGSEMDRLLDRLSSDVALGRYPAVVSGARGLVDVIYSRVASAPVELVIDGSEAERTAALAIALSGFNAAGAVSDIASDRSSERLRQLSDEVSRIASTLARLSAGPDAPPRPSPVIPPGEAPPVAADVVRDVIRARRLRDRFFDHALFADPAWDMLLDLLQAEIAQLRVPVSSLCIAAAVPATTALRWLTTMTEMGIFVRRPDPHDGRRVFVELSRDASLGMRRYFAEVGPVAAV
jgi:hypothetical protein